MAERFVLTEDEALELLAFLVSAARIQMNEAPEYGPIRLLTAAGRLAELIGERVSPATRSLLDGSIGPLPAAVLGGASPEAYAAQLDEVCRAVARHLVSHFGTDRKPA